MLHDHTILQYYLNRLSLQEKIRLLPITLRESYRSFMLPKGHPRFAQINMGLLQEIQRETWQELQRKYDVEAF